MKNKKMFVAIAVIAPVVVACWNSDTESDAALATYTKLLAVTGLSILLETDPLPPAPHPAKRHNETTKTEQKVRLIHANVSMERVSKYRLDEAKHAR